MTNTAYANPEIGFAEGYLHLAMAPDGTLIKATDETIEERVDGDDTATQLLEAIKGLEERMNLRIDALTASSPSAASSPTPVADLAADPRAGVEPDAWPAALFEVAAPEEPATEAAAVEVAESEGSEAGPEEPEHAEEPQEEPAAVRARSSAPYVAVSALLIVAGLGAIAFAALYATGVI